LNNVYQCRKDIKILLLLFLFIQNFSLFSQEMNRKITFVVFADSLSKKDTVFITGSDSILGDWDPGIVVLGKQINGSWKKELHFPEGQTIEYKFTLGSWNKEALNKDSILPVNYKLKIINDSTLTYKINQWGSGRPAFKGQVTGNVKYHYQFPGDGIIPRDIIVWLPPSYTKSTAKRYPVLYMHDGQNIIDPATSFGGIDWQADETTDSLIRKNKMEEIIIVGIYNSKDRKTEYSYTEKGNAYMNFIINKLKPFIDKNYRTLRDRKNTATIGSSLGGLISFILTWEHPEVFSMAGCLSPALKIDNLDYVSKISSYNDKKKNIKIYFDNGGVGLEKKLQPGLDGTIDILKQKGYMEGKDFVVFIDDAGEHNEAAWAKRLWRPLLFMFGKNKK
jgi:predicted alpha/beta superfamily hydrolase